MSDQRASASELFWKFRDRVRAERPRKRRLKFVAVPVAAGMLATSVLPAHAFDGAEQAVPTIKLKAGEKKLGFGFQRTIGSGPAYFDRYDFGDAHFGGVQPDLFTVGYPGAVQLWRRT